MGWMPWWTKPRPKMWVWVIAELVSINHWDCPSQARGRISPPKPVPLESALPCPWWGVGPSLPSVGANSPMGSEASSLAVVSRERHGQLPQGQWWVGKIQLGPQISTHMVATTPMGHRLHCKPQMQEEHRPRHGPWQQLWCGFLTVLLSFVWKIIVPLPKLSC